MDQAEKLSCLTPSSDSGICGNLCFSDVENCQFGQLFAQGLRIRSIDGFSNSKVCTLFFSCAVNAANTPPEVKLIVFEICAAKESEIQHNTTENRKLLMISMDSFS